MSKKLINKAIQFGMKSLIGGFLIFQTLGSAAHAEIVTSTYIACTSKDALDEAVGYAVRGDQDGTIQLIMTGQCTLLKAGERVSVIDWGLLTTTIRHKGVKLYIPSRALK